MPDDDGADSHRDELGPLIEAGASSEPPVRADPGDPLVINYTSGTTGAPKKFTRSDRVVQIGCIGCLVIGEMLFWESLFHGSGTRRFSPHAWKK